MIRTERIPTMSTSQAYTRSIATTVGALRVPASLRIAAQVAGLWFFSAGGSWLAGVAHLPIPGNVIGLSALFIALCTGLVKTEWLDLGGGVLTKHLAFFFVPLTVGLMGFGAVFAQAGFALIVTLFVSAAVGLVAAGHATQLLAKYRR